MPSRNWHAKSKSGCLQCKQRHVKCDEQRPACAGCARRRDICTYPSDTGDDIVIAKPSGVNEPGQDKHEKQLEPTHQQSQRRWHQKSRFGCLNCKTKRIKCDELRPKCRNCDGTQTVCAYPLSERPLRTMISTPITIHVAQLLDPQDVMAFEYFDLNTLPMLRACQPSVLWDCTVGFSIQTNRTLRSIAVALGYQQRLLDYDSAETMAVFRSPNVQADLLYGRALRCLGTLKTSPAETPIVALCCMLFIALECIRSSPGGLLLHLQSAVNITVQAARDGIPSLVDEMCEIASILQQLCASAWLFCTSPSYVGDYALILQNIRFDELCHSGFEAAETASPLDVHTLTSRVIFSVRRLMNPGATPQEWEASFDELHRLRTKASELHIKIPSRYPKNAGRGFLEAKVLMVQVFLERMLTYSNDFGHNLERHRHLMVLDLLDESLKRLHLEKRGFDESKLPYPFTLGTGIIQMLEVIMRTSPDADIKDHAIFLLQNCPPREGLWSSRQILQAYSGHAAPTAAGVVDRPTLAKKAEDRLATAEDVISLAQEMHKTLHIGIETEQESLAVLEHSDTEMTYTG